jgi:hypothetical protein
MGEEAAAPICFNTNTCSEDLRRRWFEQMARGRGKSSSRRKSSPGRARSAISDRYIKKSTARKSPRTTVIERS